MRGSPQRNWERLTSAGLQAHLLKARSTLFPNSLQIQHRPESRKNAPAIGLLLPWHDKCWSALRQAFQVESLEESCPPPTVCNCPSRAPPWSQQDDGRHGFGGTGSNEGTLAGGQLILSAELLVIYYTDVYHRVLSYSGTFVYQQWTRPSPSRPLRRSCNPSSPARRDPWSASRCIFSTRDRTSFSTNSA